MTSSLLEAALAELDKGQSIIPACWTDQKEKCLFHDNCQNPGKVPLVAWTEYQERCPSEAEVHGWWGRWPQANILRINGAISGVTTIDIDGDKGKETFAEQLQEILPPTHSRSTPHNGVHLDFAYAPELKTGNGRLPGIDIKNDGGMIVIPPSDIGGVPYQVTSDLPPASLDGTINKVLEVLGVFAAHEHRNNETGNGSSLGPELDGAPKWVAVAMKGVEKGRRNATAARLIGYFHSMMIPNDIIESIMLPFAERCSPPMDRTELRRTIASVTRYWSINATERITDPPAYREEGETHVFTWEKHQVELRLDDVHHGGKGLAARLEVRTTLPGDNPHVHGPVDWNLTSTSGREGLDRYLRKRIKMDWPFMLDQVARLTVRRYAEGEPAIVLRDYTGADGEQYAISPIVLEDGATIVFGDGGTTKSYLVLALMMSLTTGDVIVPGLKPATRHRGLYLDWESSPRVHHRRMKMLFAGAELTGELPDIIYRRCVGPLADQISQIRRIISEHSIGFVVVDSIGLASGGELEKPEVANRFFDAVRRLKTATACVSHVTKEGKDQKPFGSAYWHNLARSTFEVRKQQDSGESFMNIGLYHRKSNDDMLARPIGLRLNFDGDRAWYERIDVHDVPNLSKGTSNLDQMKAVLKNGRMKVADIAQKVSITENAVRAIISRKKHLFVEFPGGDGAKEWGLKA